MSERPPTGKEQMAFILCCDMEVSRKKGIEGTFSNLEELNKLLSEGWRVAATTPMSGDAGGFSIPPMIFALLVIER